MCWCFRATAINVSFSQSLNIVNPDLQTLLYQNLVRLLGVLFSTTSQPWPIKTIKALSMNDFVHLPHPPALCPPPIPAPLPRPTLRGLNKHQDSFSAQGHIFSIIPAPTHPPPPKMPGEFTVCSSQNLVIVRLAPEPLL